MKQYQYLTRLWLLVFASMLGWAVLIPYPTSAQSNPILEEARLGSTGTGYIETEVTFEIPNRPDTLDLSGCSEVLTAEYAYYAYLDIIEQLDAGQGPREVQYLDCFLVQGYEGMSAEDTIRQLYRESYVPEVLLGYLAYEFEDRIRKTLKAGKSRGGQIAWPGAYLGEAALVAYRRTGDRRFLELFVSYFNRVLLLSDPVQGNIDLYHGRIMNSWGEAMHVRTKRANDQRRWVAHVSHFGRIMTPALGFAKEMMDDPALAAEYRSWIIEVVRFFETGFQQFEADRRVVGDGSRGWYWRPLDDQFEPINHVTSLGTALIPAFQITGDPVYAARIQEMIYIFEDSAFRHEDGTLSWPYSPHFQTITALSAPIDNLFSEYSWKGAITLPFILDAHRNGYEYLPGNIDAIRKTVISYILADGKWKRTIHPYEGLEVRQKDNRKLKAALGGYHVAFIDDLEVQDLVRQMLTENLDLYAEGLLSHSGLARSYAAFLPKSSPSTLTE